MPEELDFASFLNSKIKDRSVTLRKLSELSGISMKYLESMTKGDYDDLPPAPYFRGYLTTLGTILDFDPQPWWDWFRKERMVAMSGSSDSLPQNRFAKKSYGKYFVFGVVALLVLIYAGVRFYAIIGKPQITIVNPASASSVVSQEEIILQGKVSHADIVTINGEEATLVGDGSFEKRATLQPGLNTFDFVAKKFLGNETEMMRQVYFEQQASTTGSATSSTTSSSSPIPRPGNASFATSTVR